MLQIIGWLGCVYLFVKGLEICGNQANRVKSWEQSEAERKLASGEEVTIPDPPITRLSAPSLVAALCAFVGGVIFPFLLNSQAAQIAVTTQPAQTYAECIRAASSLAEMDKCRPD